VFNFSRPLFRHRKHILFCIHTPETFLRDEVSHVGNVLCFVNTDFSYVSLRSPLLVLLISMLTYVV
jgi:hypothetical protein